MPDPRRALVALVAATLAGPALAEAPACGGIGSVGEWVGGDEAGSDLATLGAVLDVDGRVPIAGHLVRLFTLSEPTEVRVDVAARPSGDPYVAIYSEAGIEVASDDDGGDALASRLTADLDAGAYCVAARSYELGVTEVAVRVGAAALFDYAAPPPPGDELLPPRPGEGGEAGGDEAGEAGDGAATGGCDALDVPRLGDGPLDAAAMGEGVAATATVARRPAYLFELSEPVPVSVTATSEGGDPLVRLRDGAGAILAENDDADGLDARVDLATALAPGLYCVEVEELDGGAIPVTVSVRAFDAASDRLRRIGALELAPVGTDPVTITPLGALATVLTASAEASPTARWFAFDLPEGGLLVAEAVSMSGQDDPVLKLYDRVGREVAAADDGPAGLDSLLVHRAVPGRYLVGLRTYAAGTGEVRLLLERFVPAR